VKGPAPPRLLFLSHSAKDKTVVRPPAERLRGPCGRGGAGDGAQSWAKWRAVWCTRSRVGSSREIP